jgi:phage terminase large subunit-like protein
VKLPLNPRDAEHLAAMTNRELRAWLKKCGARELLMLDAAYELWASRGQIEPRAKGWRTWLMLAGRGYGKTRAGAEWVHRLAMTGKRRIALVGATIDEARAIMVEGVSGVIAVAERHGVKLVWEPSKNQIRWPSGAVASLFSGEKADGLRGPEHDFVWADELAKWRQVDAAWSNLQMGLRRGPRARVLVTTTPRPLDLLETLRREPTTVETGGKSSDNVSLPKSFVDAMIAAYGGTSLGRQELDGELLGEAEGSLWPRTLIERCRADAPETFDKIVVGVDPPVSAGLAHGEVHRGDACGIVVAGRSEGRLFVLADCSVKGASPERWARAVANAAEQWNACLVVAEANQGGAMVTSVLKAADSRLPVRLVHASRGKVARAEPVATRFAVGRAFFAGTFTEIEGELSGMCAGGAYHGPTRSPDRADAMVWAMTELSETRSGVPRVRAL